MPHLATYVTLIDHSEQVLAESFRVVAESHRVVPDVHHLCLTLADMSGEHRRRLEPVVARYGEADDLPEPERLRSDALPGGREGEIGLVRDLQDLLLLATLVRSTWTVIAQGAQGLRDRDLFDLAESSSADTARQLAWLTTRTKAAAAQALIVAS